MEDTIPGTDLSSDSDTVHHLRDKLTKELNEQKRTKIFALSFASFIVFSLTVFFMYTVCDGLSLFRKAVIFAERQSAAAANLAPDSQAVPPANKDSGAAPPVNKNAHKTTAAAAPIQARGSRVMELAVSNMYQISIWAGLTAAMITTIMLAFLRYSFGTNDHKDDRPATYEPPLLSALTEIFRSFSEFLKKKS